MHDVIICYAWYQFEPFDRSGVCCFAASLSCSPSWAESSMALMAAPKGFRVGYSSCNHSGHKCFSSETALALLCSGVLNAKISFTASSHWSRTWDCSAKTTAANALSWNQGQDMPSQCWPDKILGHKIGVVLTSLVIEMTRLILACLTSKMTTPRLAQWLLLARCSCLLQVVPHSDKERDCLLWSGRIS